MADKITEEAKLLCDKGTTVSELKVTSQTYCKAEGKLVATEEDKQADTNILSFGKCTIKKSSCKPAPIKWDKMAEQDSVNGFKILTVESICQCAIGGKISVQDKGHGGDHVVM